MYQLPVDGIYIHVISHIWAKNTKKKNSENDLSVSTENEKKISYTR